MITGQWHGALAGIRGAEQNGDDAIVAGGARYLAGVAINDHARTLNAGSDTALRLAVVAEVQTPPSPGASWLGPPNSGRGTTST